MQDNWGLPALDVTLKALPSIPERCEAAVASAAKVRHVGCPRCFAYHVFQCVFFYPNFYHVVLPLPFVNHVLASNSADDMGGILPMGITINVARPILYCLPVN